METFCYLVDVHEGSCCVCQDVLVTDCEDGVLPVDGHQRGLRVQHDVGVSVLLVPVQVDQRLLGDSISLTFTYKSLYRQNDNSESRLM